MSEYLPAQPVNIWSYEGRSSRTDYFVVLLITSVLGAISGTIMVEVGGGIGFFSGIFFVAVMWVSMCACVRRLHDVGHSGWWTLVVFIPVANFFLGLYALFAPGQEHGNDFGPPTSKPSVKPSRRQDVVKFQRPAVSSTTVMAEVPTQNLASSEIVDVDPFEEYWAQALQECDDRNMRPGLWAKALADSQGQEAVAKAQYMRLRATQLQLEHNLARDQIIAEQERVLQAEMAQQKAHEIEQAEALAKLSKDEQREALKPKGRCPNCSAVIALDAQDCPCCHANFGVGSAWKVLSLSSAEQVAFRSASRATQKSDSVPPTNEWWVGDVALYVGVLLLFFLFLGLFK